MFYEGQRGKHGGLEGRLNKSCLLPGSRRQRQKNLGDREMLVPWGEMRDLGGKWLEVGDRNMGDEFEEWVGQSQGCLVGTVCAAEDFEGTTASGGGLTTMTAEWKWDLAHTQCHQGGMESERGEGPIDGCGEGEPGTALHLEEEEKGPAGGPPTVQKSGGMGREKAIGTGQDLWVPRGSESSFLLVW